MQWTLPVCSQVSAQFSPICVPFCFEEVWEWANDIFWTSLPTGDSGVISYGVVAAKIALVVVIASQQDDSWW